jgi:protein involved in polysaccharide export with SLBB domain
MQFAVYLYLCYFRLNAIYISQEISLLKYVYLLFLLCFISAKNTIAAEPYVIGSQDKLRVEIYEFPNVSGEYIVRPDGNMDLPLVGSVQAAGLSERQLAEQIRNAIAAQPNGATLPSTSVTVQIAQYRPFFILGDVERPGSYAYQPDLTVLQALSLAGGLYRIKDAGVMRLSRDTYEAQGSLQKARLRLVELTYQRARLLAEARNQTEIGFPDSGAEGAFTDLIAGAREHETAIFKARRSTFNEQQETLQKLQSFYAGEIQSLEKEIDLRDGQLELEKQQLSVMNNLASKGIVTASRSLEQRRAAADIESRQQELRTQIFHAKQGLAQTEQSLQDLVGARQQDVANALKDTDRLLKDAEQDEKTALNLIYEAQVLAPQAYANQADALDQPTSYEIVRGRAHIAASEDGTLRPGDVLRVRQSRVQNAVKSAPEVLVQQN